jgi:hypothetical protein
MSNAVTPTRTGPVVLRWLGRGLSVLMLVLLVPPVVGGGGSLAGIFRGTHGMCMLFPFGVCVGMALAWRWQLVGAVVSLVSLALFYLLHFFERGRFPGGPWFLVFTLPAVLFLASWLWAARSLPRRSSD